MRSNRFYISIVLNCLLLFAAAFLFFYFLNIRQQPSTAAGVAVVAFLLVVRLIYFVNRSNRMLSAFLIHLQENDPSLAYTRRYTDKNFRGLNESLEKLIQEFKENRIDLEIQTQYLEALLGNISTGIISFDDSGMIRTMNQAARNILATGSITQLKEVEQLYREELKDASVVLSYQQDCNSELEADEQMMEQVLINLVKNAAEAVRDNKKPEIDLSCYSDSKGHICLSVKDNGEGIQPDKLEQVFVPFFTTRKEGSGIGLSLCRQIIRLHDGQIKIESEPGEGTTVVLRF